MSTSPHPDTIAVPIELFHSSALVGLLLIRDVAAMVLFSAWYTAVLIVIGFRRGHATGAL